MLQSRRWKWAGLLLASTTLASGCYGSFNLTQRLWNWNGTVTGNKWANEGIFLVCAILPVYSICMLGDAIIFNSFEFWGAKNPVDAPGLGAMPRKLDDTHTMTLEHLADNKVKVEIFELGELRGTYTLDTSSGTNTRLLDADGNLLAIAEQQADGEVKLVASR